MKKNNLIILIFIAIFGSSCSIQHTILNPTINEIDNKIRPLLLGLHGDNIFRNPILDVSTLQNYQETLFRRTLHQNIFEDIQGAWGYVDFRVTFNKKKYVYSLFPINFSFYPLFLFGLPVKMTFEQQIEIAIYDSNKELIKNYILLASLNDYVNIYNNKIKKKIIPLKLLESLLRDFELQVDADSDYINKQLNDSGEIKILEYTD